MGKEEQINKKIDKAYISSLAFNADECEICLSDEVKKEYGLKFKNGKFIFFKKKPKYPKTYKECFNICFGDKYHIIQVVGLDGLGNNKELFENFIKLKICRDAYWKIAGDWKPNFTNQEEKFIIANYNRVLIFPTEEMRDAFYENFKELIEECKELL